MTTPLDSNKATQDNGTAPRHGVAYTLGRVYKQVRRGDWGQAAETLRLNAWLGRYIGCLLALAFALFVTQIFVEVPISWASTWNVLLISAGSAIILLPIGISLNKWLLGRLGFSLLARRFGSGCMEGIFIAVLCVAIYATYTTYILTQGLRDNVATEKNGNQAVSNNQPSRPRRNDLGPLPAEAPPRVSGAPIGESLRASFRVRQSSGSAAYHRGKMLLEVGDLEAALVAFNEAIEVDPKLWPAIHHRGRIHAELGDLEKAIEDYSLAISLDSMSSSVYLDRANARYLLGGFRDAIADCDATLSRNHEQLEAYQLRGRCQTWLGEHEQAIQDFTKGLRLDPKSAPLFTDRAFCLASTGYFDDAIADCDRAIGLNPELAESYYMRGRVYRKKGDDRRAVDDFTKSLEIDPEFASACGFRALTLMSSKDMRVRDVEQAFKDAQKSCELTGWQDWMAIDTLARAYEHKGDKQNAAKYSEMAEQIRVGGS